MNQLIYIGDHFYWDSGTSMSSLYSIDGSRWDWNRVSQALENGESVSIRPATRDELALYELKLDVMNKKVGV